MNKTLKIFMPLVLSALMSFGLAACGSPRDNEGSTPPSATGNVLIAYFSATGTTENVAEMIADATGGTNYKIVAEDPYTAADLDYYSGGRADQEQNDLTARPAISGSIDNPGSYDVVFLGYPIWHGQAPRIISTFLESYDFTGKTIVPFCTSASSGIGNSDTNLHALAPDAEWQNGRRFARNVTAATVAQWVKELSLASRL